MRKPGLQLRVAEQREEIRGHKILSELWIISCPELSQLLCCVIYNYLIVPPSVSQNFVTCCPNLSLLI